jgi:hypothetical protein
MPLSNMIWSLTWFNILNRIILTHHSTGFLWKYDTPLSHYLPN